MRRKLEGFPTLRLAVAVDDKVGIGRIVALYSVHPLHTKFTERFGVSISETTM